MQIRFPINTLFLMFSFSAVYCNNRHESLPSPAIVLIFNNAPPFLREMQPFPSLTIKDGRPQLTIFDDFHATAKNLRPQQPDTIIYYPQGDHIVLSFLYSIEHAPFDYVIMKGDTVNFQFHGNLPYATSSNQALDDALNYEYSRFKVNADSKQFTPYELYLSPFAAANNRNEAIDHEYFIKPKQYPLANKFLIHELQFLNEAPGLREKHTLTYDFLHDKLNNQLVKIGFEQGKISADSLRNVLIANKTANVHAAYSYFLPFLQLVANKKIVSQARVLKSDNGSIIDYRDAYDRINTWNEINDFYKKQLLFQYLKLIGENFSSADLTIYTSKFAAFSKDTVLVNEIRKEFPSQQAIAANHDDMLMINTANTQTTLQAFLRENKGNVIYIDFWASWCVPCRKEAEHARALRAAFKDKNLVFAYFSIDKSKTHWAAASKEDMMNELKHNYLLIDWSSSVFLKEIGFGPIPRYLLFDKSGKLVHKKAPGPGSTEIHRLLTQYLSQ